MVFKTQSGTDHFPILVSETWTVLDTGYVYQSFKELGVHVCNKMTFYLALIKHCNYKDLPIYKFVKYKSTYIF